MSTDTPQSPAPAVIVVGASAGGVEALRDFVSMLPADLPACVLLVLHVPSDSPSALPSILRRVAKMPVRQAENGDRLRAGEVLVARPDRHLVVSDGVTLLTRGPKENGHRPAVDVLFRSAARAYGPRVLGLVLSGALDDGAAGAVSIAARGGTVAVQDFDEASYPSMPRSAALAVGDAAQASLEGLAVLAEDWARRQPLDATHLHDVQTDLRKEVGVARMEPDAMHDLARPGTPSGFGCPDCAGSLFQIEEGDTVRYRCRVGHAWSSTGLVARQVVALEGALWVALRSLEERAALNTELGDRADARSHDRTAKRFRENATEALEAAESVRQLLADVGQGLDTTDGHDRVVGQ